MDKRDELNQIKDAEREYQADAAKYPVGTQLIVSDTVTAEIVAADGLTRTVRTNGVDRPATVAAIDTYVASGKIKGIK